MDDLAARLKKIGKVFDISEILGRSEDTRAVADYYRINRVAYWLFNSRRGFVHMGISRNGVFTKDDFLAQPKLIAEYIRKAAARNVLELAAGKGANLNYLASQFPEVQFTGLDLPNGQLNTSRFKRLPNVRAVFGDFHDLATFKDSSVDIIYIIEALCHSPNKELVIEQVARILRPGGYLIVFDGYVNYQGQPNNMINQASLLVMKSMRVPPNHQSYKEFLTTLEDAGFNWTEENLSEAILPTASHFERRAYLFFRYPQLARTLKKIFPNEFTENAIAGYLIPLNVKLQIQSYWLTVCQKAH